MDLETDIAPEVTFDGLRYTFDLETEPQVISFLVGTSSWYLSAIAVSPEYSGTSFQSEPEQQGLLKARYDFEYTTEADYPNSDKLWKALYLFSMNEFG